MSSFLETIAKYSNADCFVGTDKVVYHSYGPIYNDIVADLSTKANPCVLEIGIATGAFLKVLSECLPHACLTGVDADLSRNRYSEPNIRLFQLDATLSEALQTVDGTTSAEPNVSSASRRTYDLIIDDASHVPEHQLRTLDLFAPRLRSGGYYVIEDVRTPLLEGQLREVGQRHGLEMTWVDLRHKKNLYDDVLAVFTRK